MTRDQMHNTLRYVREQLAEERGSDFSGVKALDLVLEELVREPSGDLISRKAVIDAIDKWAKNMGVLIALPVSEVTPLFDSIHALPPVNPQEPKTGHWIKSRDSYGNNHFTCPFCEHDIATKYAGTWKDNYCSNCGARMERSE